jgi:hypothetical protein
MEQRDRWQRATARGVEDVKSSASRAHHPAAHAGQSQASEPSVVGRADEGAGRGGVQRQGSRVRHPSECGRYRETAKSPEIVITPGASKNDPALAGELARTIGAVLRVYPA